jgi:hypothetical protein
MNENLEEKKESRATTLRQIISTLVSIIYGIAYCCLWLVYVFCDGMRNFWNGGTIGKSFFSAIIIILAVDVVSVTLFLTNIIFNGLIWLLQRGM